MKRVLIRIIIGFCWLIIAAGLFVGIAVIAGGFGAHSLEQKVIGVAIGFGTAMVALYVAYAISRKDTGDVFIQLISALLTGWW